MNFFEHQDRARRRTKKLVALFVVSVVLIVIAVNAAVYGISRLIGQYSRYYRDAAPVLREDLRYPGRFTTDDPFAPHRVFGTTTAITLLIILAGSAYKTMMLASGGPAVAQMLGGRPIIADAGQERVLQNVVEEMSIASGVPVPQVYVLDREQGINAFAAGRSTEDAVIGVTRGALEKLNRDELQGVIAHEFSHILNGDMRLNVRLIGVLHGILFISIIGYGLLNSLRYVRVSGRRGDKAAAGVLIVLMLGAALYVIGWIGVFFGRIIQAAVSRQREFLADASAVQFTRNPAGLVGALKKLGASSSGSKLSSAAASSAAHIFFANCLGFSLSRLLATHPPLEQRIRAIDPTFDGRFEVVERFSGLLQQYGGGAAQLTGFGADRRAPCSPQTISAAAGVIAPGHISFAAALIDSLPASLIEAARDPFSARALVLALLSSKDPQVRQRQLAAVQAILDPACCQQMLKLIEASARISEAARLPLLDVAMPTLRQLSPRQAVAFRNAARAMIQADGRVTLFEYMLGRLIDKHLVPPDRGHRAAVKYYAVSAIRDDAAVLLSALAAASSAETQRAFSAAALRLDPGHPPAMVSISGLSAIDQALNRLAGSSPAVKKRLVEAATVAVAFDGQVNVQEAELLRATCAALDVPLPPLLHLSIEASSV